MFARGTIIGITRGTNACHIIRAALESIAYQSKEILDAIVADTGIELHQLKVDGGASANGFLMQFQADIIDRPVLRPVVRETTALGAAFLAGLQTGFWKREELCTTGQADCVYEPSMLPEERERLLRGWKKAVERALDWAEK